LYEKLRNPNEKLMKTSLFWFVYPENKVLK